MSLLRRRIHLAFQQVEEVPLITCQRAVAREAGFAFFSLDRITPELVLEEMVDLIACLVVFVLYHIVF